MFVSFYIGLQDTLSKYCVQHTQSQLGTNDCFSQLRISQLDNSIMLSLLCYLSGIIQSPLNFISGSNLISLSMKSNI